MRRALALAALLLVAGCGGGEELERFELESAFVGQTLEQGAWDPGEPGRPLLVLLHGRGSDPDDVWTLGLGEELDRLGERAPAALLVNGGEASYFHDRRNGRWGSYVVDEAIPAAIRRLRADPARVAVGGISMGGFGARPGPAPSRTVLRCRGPLSRLVADRRRDTRGGVRRRGGLLPPRPLRRPLPWSGRGLDRRRRDRPVPRAATVYARRLRQQGRDVTLHVWPGGHDRDYRKAHLRAYLDLYVAAFARC